MHPALLRARVKVALTRIIKTHSDNTQLYCEVYSYTPSYASITPNPDGNLVTSYNDITAFVYGNFVAQSPWGVWPMYTNVRANPKGIL